MNPSLPMFNYWRGLFCLVDDKVKIPSISLGLPELPSGVHQTRTFNYSRRNYRNLDLTIGKLK